MADKNRCSGCEHYDGFTSNHIVRCAIKEKANIANGCGSFSPDSTAECGDCYYNESNPRTFDLTCRYYGKHFGSSKSHCEGYALAW
jgi:hypothetical protein